jgi:tRNA threonylcarbamoyladenosine biosynthesis protein TsaB
MKTILLIDTTSNQKIKVGLNKNGEEFFIEQPLDKQKAQIVLPLIDKLLKKHNLTIKNINSIQVNPGPGSFTGIRVGYTIANTLAFLLKVPIH